MNSAAGSHILPLAGLVLFLLLLQSVFFAVTYIYFRNEIKQMNENYIRNNVACLVGDDFSYVFQAANLHNADDKIEPCREVRKQVQRVIRMILEEKYGHEITSLIKEKVSDVLPVSVAEKQVYTGPMIAAHVTGSHKKAMPAVKMFSNVHHNGHKITEWSNNTLAGMNSIKVQNGELVIVKPGFYYIYAQTYFRHQDNEGKVKQLVQHIYKMTSYRDPIALMKNVKTTCWSKSAEYGLHSIYQGGVFKLNENDRLFVTVSDKNILDMDEKATFFGAFLVF
ncbi:tumor necrosis factor ligand superfamily member 10 [Bufo gargarizans]|uniref:tumor necrosis factor ligand superfamily member 10 n=1 Tax=Bufo gargarizans TaxID=30331 RepID=UPI001CF36472|nr:tumor necrosis factor ligand superfamily member 10 [Bufo gargarizans]